MQGADRQVFATDFDHRAPFGSVLVDLVADAVGRLDRPVWLSGDAVGSLVDDLLHRLASLAGPALLEMYRGSDVGYTAFTRHLDGHLGELQDAFPVLSDLLEGTAERWASAMQTLLGQLDADLDEVRALVPGPATAVDAIASGLGDPHAGGRTVCRVRFGDEAVAYKPRSLAGEAWYADLAALVASACHDEAPPGRVIDRGDHGWMSWIDRRPSFSPATYWRRAGRTAAILWFTGAVDMHHANLVATGDHLVPVDLECLAQPDLWPQQHPPRSRPIDDSVVMTGMLPFRYRPDAPIAHHISGLYAVAEAQGGGWTHEWTNLGTDGIDRRRVPSGAVASPNAPIDEIGRGLPLDIERTIEGFEEALTVLGGPQGPGDDHRVAGSRVILRATSVYASTLAEMTALDSLADRRRFDERARSLPEPAPHIRALLGDGVAAFAAVEAAALRRLDVPIHHADGADLVLDRSVRLPGRITRLADDRHRDRLLGLDVRGRRLQTDLLRLALDQVGPPAARPRRPPRPAPAAPTRPTALVEAAVALGDQLAGEALTTDHGLVWLHLDQRTPVGAHSDGAGVYCGGGGMALAFGALAALTGDDRFATLARRSLVPVAAMPEHRWWDTGRAGEGYARMVLGDVLDDGALTDEGLELIRSALGGDPDPGDPIDLLGGWGGVLAAGLAAIERGHGTLADPTAALADTLARLIDQRSGNEVERRGLHRLGFAHGITGTSWLLHRTAAALDRRDLASVAEELIDVEEARIALHDGVPGRSTNLDGTRRAMPSWCWGVAGYALARTSPWSSPTVPLDVAIDLLADTDRIRSHLCCGEAGQLVVVDEVARRTASAAAEHAAASLTAALVDDAVAGGPWSFYDECRHAPAGLFWGRAGVVYALARVAEPALVPNVLAIE